MLDEQQRILENLKTIREYLMNEFASFVMTEDASDPSILHRFTMTNAKTHEQFKLKVDGRDFLTIPTILKNFRDRSYTEMSRARCVNTKVNISIGDAYQCDKWDTRMTRT